MLSPENKLWVAVFERAWDDMHGRTGAIGSASKATVRAQALAYFEGGGFRHDCYLNGWEPEWVLKVLAQRERMGVRIWDARRAKVSRVLQEVE